MSYVIDRNNLPQVDYRQFSDRSTCLNYAAGCVDIANEEWAVARKIHDFILRALFFSSITLIAAIGVIGILSPVTILALPVLGTLSTLPTLLLIHSLWKRGTHLERAQKLEVMALLANRRAAELPPWSDKMGKVTYVLTYLFSTSNPITRFGKETISGRSTHNYY